MINKSRELSDTKIDIANMRYKINDNNLVGVLEPIYKKILIRKKLFIQIEKAQIKDNLQVCIL